MANEKQPRESTETASILVLDESERFKVAQAIYGAVTGKTEKLTKSFGKNYMVRRPDLQQLHAKCSQACTQWNVLQKNSSVTVHHVDENNEQFSSFDRFNIYDASKTAPVESIVYEFNILVGIKNDPKPQNYKVTVRILSKVAIFKKMEDDMAPPSLMRYFGNAAIVVEIEYVDYVIARNLLGMVDSWVAEVEQQTTWEWARKTQNYTHWIPIICQLGLIVVSVIGLEKATKIALSATSSPPEMVSWIIYMAGGLWIAAIVAKSIGEWIENAIDSINDISAIVINKGDERLVCRFTAKNKWKSLQAVLGTALVILQGVFTKTLTTLLVGLIHK